MKQQKGLMLIGIDGNPWIYEKGGIGRYTKNIVRSLLAADKKNQYIIFFNTFRGYFRRKKEISQELKPFKNAKIKFLFCPGKIRDLLFGFGYPAPLFFRQKLDLFFAPYFSGIDKNGYGNQVVVIHDLAFYKLKNVAAAKQVSWWKRCTQRAVQNCRGIISVSWSTKRDIAKIFGGQIAQKVKVIYPGIDHAKFNFLKSKNQKNYILSVCSVEPRKNLAALVAAYHLLEEKLQKQHPLILVGEIRWGVSKLFEKIKASKNIKTTGYLSDRELIKMYQAARVFIYPSVYEGFGLPPLEAMAAGTPVLVGRNSSLPEVCGRAATYINEKDPQDIAQKIKKILNFSNRELAKIARQSKKQAQKFRWRKTAQETIDFFNYLYEKNLS